MFCAWEPNTRATIQNQWSSLSSILWMVSSLTSPTRLQISFLILISESSHLSGTKLTNFFGLSGQLVGVSIIVYQVATNILLRRERQKKNQCECRFLDSTEWWLPTAESEQGHLLDHIAGLGSSRYSQIFSVLLMSHDELHGGVPKTFGQATSMTKFKINKLWWQLSLQVQ